MPATWRIELLGGVRLSRDGVSLPLPRTQKAILLLAFLALYPRQHTRDELADLFWPDVPYDAAHASLRNALSLLRRTLGDGLLETPGRRTVGLNPDTFTCDAAELIAAITAEHAETARRLWSTGPLLTGYWDEWIVEERDRLEARLAALPSSDAGAKAPLPALPLEKDRFFGREEEIAQISALLTANRMVTLLGPGGVGKTRLSLAIARHHTAQESLFRGGAGFVSLAEVTEPERILPAIRDALGLPRRPDADLVAQITDHIDAQASPVLVILDNFEQIAASGAPVIESLLATASPSLCLLITSRRRLGLPGERLFEVPPLSADPAAALFRDRAPQSLSSPTDAENDPEVLALVRDLEGIPLAIELCAARASAFTVSEMRALLAERFALLAEQDSDRTPRHHSLRAAIEWSFRLLTAQQRHLFLRLSVFRGGWTREAAEAVCCDEPEAAECLAQLRERSLIMAEWIGGTLRFRMLESLRAFAEESLRAEESGKALAEIERRHVAYFADMAQEYYRRLIESDARQWLDRLEADHDNLRRALLCASPEQALKLTADLWRFWEIRGYYAEGRANLAAALASPAQSEKDSPEATRSRVRALLGLGTLAYAQGDHTAAVTAQSDAVNAAIVAGDDEMAARSNNNLGLTLMRMGRLEEARIRLEDALTFFEATNSDYGRSATLTNLGLVHFRLGDLESAYRCHEGSLKIDRARGDLRGIAYSLNGLAKLLTEMSRYDEACERYAESLHIKQELGDRAGVASALCNLGILARKQERMEEAERLQRESLALRIELGLQHGILESLVNFAELAAAHDPPERAAVLLGAAETLATALASPMPESQTKLFESLAATRSRPDIAAALARGRSMGFEEAASFALNNR